MNSEQIKDMHLLYNAVYNEELREQFDEYNNTIYDDNIVEFATEYFYSHGLNDDGIDILIEELGVGEFAEFVYDIVEECTLTEARRSGRIEPITKSGKPIGSLKGGAKASAIAAKRRQKQSERNGSDDRPSGMTAALRSQATKAASKKQSETKSTPDKTKKGIASKIGSALKRAGEDIAITYKVAREVGKRAEKSAPVRKFWGFKDKEEVKEWVNQLVEEGYDLSEYTWDEMAEIYEQNINQIEEGIGSLLLKGGKALLPKLKNIGSMFKKVELPPAKAPMSANARRASELRVKHNIGSEGSDTSPKMQILNRTNDKVNLAQREVNRGNASNSYVNDAKAVRQGYLDAGYSKYGGNDAAGRRTLGGRGSTGTPDPSGPGSYHPSAGTPPGDRGRGGKAFAKAQRLNPGLTYTQYSKELYKSSKKPSMIPMALNNSYEHDVFDTILEYLIVEGYADTNENAIVIMTNMSEEWRESIVEMNNLPSGGKTPTMKYDTGKSGGTMKYDTGKSTGKSVYKKGPDGRPSPYQPM